MFGLPSPSKLVVLVAVVLAVWYGFKWINQLDKSRKDGAPRRTRKGGSAGDDVKGIETQTCPTCGTYFPASVGSYCGGSRCKDGGA